MSFLAQASLQAKNTWLSLCQGKRPNKNQFIKILNNIREVMKWHGSSSHLSTASVTINTIKVP